jgi:hypothetical protein
MKRKWINIAAVTVGLALGPSSLASVKAAQPPIDWPAIPFALAGCVIGGIFVTGIHVLRKDPKYGRLVFTIFVPLSVFMLGTGLGALVNGILKGEYGPSSFFFLAIGTGLMSGVLLSRIAYRSKFKNSL